MVTAIVPNDTKPTTQVIRVLLAISSSLCFKLSFPLYKVHPSNSMDENIATKVPPPNPNAIIISGQLLPPSHIGKVAIMCI